MARPLSIDLVSTGDPVARFSYCGVPDSDRFEVKVVIGNLQSTATAFEGATIMHPGHTDSYNGIDIDDERNEHVGHVASAACIDSTFQYGNDVANHINLVANLGEWTSFYYVNVILLRNLRDADVLDEAVAGLMDRHALEEMGNSWEVSVVGLSGIRALRRKLFVATGEPEQNIPVTGMRALTDPQTRANALHLVGAVAFDSFLAMPPVKPVN